MAGRSFEIQSPTAFSLRFQLPRVFVLRPVPFWLPHLDLRWPCLPYFLPGSSVGEAGYQVASCGLEDACGLLAAITA